jgi:transposase
MCLLRSAAGEKAATIARITGLSLDAVTRIRRRWRTEGLRSLADRPRCGRPAVVTDAYLRHLRQALARGPGPFGYVFTVWSIARLGAHLRERTGITLSTDWLRRLVHQQGFAIGRPKHTLANKRNRREYEQARAQLEKRKKGPAKRTRRSSCGTPTPRSSNSCLTWSDTGCPRDASRR